MPNPGSDETPGPDTVSEAIDPATLLGRPPPSLRWNSVARIVSDTWTLVMSLVAATVTARLLGLAGKGFYSTLLLLAGAFIQVFGAGLGEAALVLAGQGRFALRHAAEATATAIVPFALAGGAIFVVTSRIILQPSTADERTAVLFGGGLVATMVLYGTAVSFLLAQERLTWVAGLAVILATLTTVAIWFLTAGFHLGSAGAILGSLLAAAACLVGGLALLRRVGILGIPRWSPGFLRPAARLGAQLQLSSLLVTLTARVDLVMVYRLRDPSTAGAYSVALTVGALVGIIPIAVSYALFPRLAWVGEDEAQALTAQMFREGMALGAVLGVALALTTPFVVPRLFGTGYRGAIVPTLVLLPAGLFSSAQWLLARALAARGRPRSLWVSFAVNFSTMVLIDLVLIPLAGATGAGLGSLVACAVGFITAAWYYRDSGLHWRDFLPCRADVAHLLSILPRPHGRHFQRRRWRTARLP